MNEPIEIQPYIEQGDGEQQQIQEFKNEFDVASLLTTVGTLSDEVVDLAKERGLWNPVNDEEVEIRPDGLIYVPWTVYAKRMTDAFPLQWGLVPQGMPKIHTKYVVWGFWLVIRGVLCGFAIGEQEYQPTNSRMTWTDAVEGAKSNALMRLCKGVGLFPELWTPSYVRGWKGNYAEQYTDDRGRKVWRRKDSKFRAKVEGVIDVDIVAEPEKKVEPEKSVIYTADAKPGDELLYPLGGKVIQHLVELKLFENGHAAAKAIGPIFAGADGKVSGEVPFRTIVEKATLYRQWKDHLTAGNAMDDKEATKQAVQNAINNLPIK